MEQKIISIRKQIEEAAQVSGRTAADITTVAVTKTVDSTTVSIAYELGLHDFGENRVQKLKEKIASVPQARWHMIGRLQTNKVKDVVGKVCLIHSLDRWRLAEELDKRGKLLGVEVPALVQINISGEQQKAGLHPADVKSFLTSVGQFEALKIYGFMTVAPQVVDPEETRPIFKELYNLKQELSSTQFVNVDLRYLSMGMSQDFTVAIEEGANIVRIGSAIFTQG